MKKYLFILMILATGFLMTEACNPEKKAENPNASPEAVVQVVFDAANSGNLDVLPSLCDPLGENDEDVQRICETADGLQDQFIEFFKDGKISGPVQTEGNEANVPVTFNNGDTDNIRCIQRDGLWYLFGM